MSIVQTLEIGLLARRPRAPRRRQAPCGCQARGRGPPLKHMGPPRPPVLRNLVRAALADPAALHRARTHGDYGRVRDWLAYFAEEIDRCGWQRAVATWVPRLVPGMFAALTHGLIRTAHALRTVSST